MGIEESGGNPGTDSGFSGFFDKVDAWIDARERDFRNWLDRVLNGPATPGTGDVGSPTGGSGGEVLTDRNEGPER